MSECERERRERAEGEQRVERERERERRESGECAPRTRLFSEPSTRLATTVDRPFRRHVWDRASRDGEDWGITEAACRVGVWSLEGSSLTAGIQRGSDATPRCASSWTSTWPAAAASASRITSPGQNTSVGWPNHPREPTPMPGGSDICPLPRPLPLSLLRAAAAAATAPTGFGVGVPERAQSWGAGRRVRGCGTDSSPNRSVSLSSVLGQPLLYRTRRSIHRKASRRAGDPALAISAGAFGLWRLNRLYSNLFRKRLLERFAI